MLCVSPFLVIRTLRGRKSDENESKNYYQDADPVCRTASQQHEMS